MNLGILLPSGDSLANMAKFGQFDRFREFYINSFAKNFKKVFIFSYEDETEFIALQKGDNRLPKNVIVVSNKFGLHRFIYGLIMPFLNYNYFIKCDIFRAYHLLGTLPGVVGKIFLNKQFIFNYGYDYFEFARIEGKVLQYYLLKIISPISCFFAYKIIAVTKLAIKFTPPKKTIFIPNGVDIKVFKPLKVKNKSGRLRVLNVGRLEPQKNQVNLVKSLKNSKVDLQIIGQGKLRSKLELVAKSNAVQLEIVDHVNNLSLPTIYNKADIFMLPSLTEGPVKVLLEAMACGLAVIGAKVNGIDEVIIDRENGLFCQINPTSIRSALDKLTDNEALRKKLGENARLYIVKNHDLKVLLKKEIDILKG